MARRKRYSVEEIIEAAFGIVRREGMHRLTARAIAEALHASTMPVYTHLKSMAEIEAEVVRRAWSLLREFQVVNRSGDRFIDIGLGYVLFARDERHLFNCIHAETYQEMNAELGEANFEFHLQRLLAAGDPVVRGVSRETARKILFYGWVFSHGFASLLTSGVGREVKQAAGDKVIAGFFEEVTGIFQAGLRATIPPAGK